METPDFGTRKCELCKDEIPAQVFGRHIAFGHSPEDVADWPGGKSGYIRSLLDSLDQSIEASEDFPEIQAPLKESRLAIGALALQHGIDIEKYGDFNPDS